ncbi:MAG: class I SAM-dependent methyltransferase [Elusimicrobiota bacterium]|nr:MAG: class I SAM-dependent methyltransferase [Elusimicrobiota bacterium]
MARYKYLLGDSRGEAERLRFQAKLWDPVSLALFDRLGVKPGMKVLEIGPGQGSLHLELRRRVKGPVDAVERSAPFAGRLRRLCEKDGRGRGTIWERDLIDAPLPAGKYDLIFARWVFLFLPEPLAHLKKLAKALKPGGRIAIQDYHRESMRLYPTPPDWDELFAADVAFFKTQGGDASIGAKLPALYKKAGLIPESAKAELKTGFPGSDVWTWASWYFLGVMPRLGKIKPFTPAAARRVAAAWRAAGRRPDSLFVAPAVLDAVARKPRR